MLLRKLNSDKYDLLLSYVEEVTIGDKTNREGHAAKVYFNTLFGMDFVRNKSDDINAALNYGYAILFVENEKEKNMNGKLKIFVDFFYFQFDSKKYINDISKFIVDHIEEDDRNNLVNLYHKIIKVYNRILNGIDLPLKVDSEISIDTITKFVKIVINVNGELLDNLLLLIDLEKVLKTNNTLIFVNLKQYLTKEEVIELYKYSIYNNIHILLVDSQAYGGTLTYECKLIIDENLDEFMI